MLKAALSLFLCTASCLCASAAKAQVASDGTVNTQVDRNGNVTEITGGETRGGNLFHSFQDFSVPTNNEAFFNNADNIANIFSRVTGGNISNIDGIIRANGSASLFLINPAGIIFGENARLDLGGSFFGSTASSIVFEDGNFSAIDNLEQPTLTVNAPIGLGFRDEPGEIVNRSFVQNQVGEFAGLEVSSGQTLGLIGGNISFEAGEATAPGGNIYLGGLAEAGTVDLNEDGSLNLPEDSTLSNITLTNAASVDVRGMGGGNITIDAQNLSLAAGESGSSSIRGGIAADSTSQEAQAGNIIINVVENTSLNDSRIVNQVDTEGVGSSGNISLNTDSLALTNGGSIDASTFGSGNAGAVSVTATEDITAEGENSRGFSSGITSQVIPGAEGNSGGVTISTTNLSLAGGGRVAADTLGSGDAGAVSVTATGDITAEGESFEGFPSGITSQVIPGAEGNSGGVTISTTNLSLAGSGLVAASTGGQGDAGAVSVTATGDITAEGEDSEGFSSGITSGINPGAEGNSGGVTISTTNLSLAGGGQVDASTRGQGDAGAVSVTATGDITAEGENSEGFPSSIASAVNPGAEGDAGGVAISTNNLSLINGGQVDATTFGSGDAGAVSVTATGDITAEGENSRGFPSGITSVVNLGAEGDAGGVTISTTNLSLAGGGQVDASTRGQGDAGAVSITATGNITAEGVNSRGITSSITSGVNPGVEGNAGGITISTANLSLTDGARIAASTAGQGNAGAVSVTATGDITAEGLNSRGITSGITSLVGIGAEGDAGGVTISTTNLNLTNGGQVDVSTGGQGNAGDIDIDASNSIFLSGVKDFQAGISADAVIENGNGGDVNISTGRLEIINNGIIKASNFDFADNFIPGTGLPGNITIDADTLDLDGGTIGAATQSTQGVRANIDLNIADRITLKDDSFISAQAFNEANGGNLTIDTDFVIAFPEGDNDIIASAEQGRGGNIIIGAESLLGIEERSLNPNTNDINASSEITGLEGTVRLIVPDIDPVPGSIELPTNIVVPEQTTAQICQSSQATAARGGLTVSGKGGVPSIPESPLDSDNIYLDAQTNSVSTTPQLVTTSQGKIQPARGIEIAPDGTLVLTAYRTNNAGDRLPETKLNCS